jgi:5'(3')-deoxyribonucleotidase
MNHLTILFDADDVAEQLMRAWLGFINRRYGTAVAADEVTDWDVSLAFPSLSKFQVYGALLEDEVWDNLTPMPGALKYLGRLHDEGHQLYLVTATDYRTCPKKIAKILELFPFLDASHIIITSNKQMVRGDVLVDDGPHNLIGGEYFKILFSQPHNRSFDERAHGIVRAKNWAEVYRLIQDNLISQSGESST